MKKRIAINGFGRIGRAVTKLILEQESLELVAINDLMPIEKAKYLLKFDSVYGNYKSNIETDTSILKINAKDIHYTSNGNPEKLPWKELKIDVVIESTGFFTLKSEAEKHIIAGAKRVVISGPSENAKTIVYGVNKPEVTDKVFSCASCTTNNITPIIEILGRRIGIKKAILNTTHAGTASQSIVDTAKGRDLRMNRSSFNNLIPTTTGAAVATTKALPKYKGLFDGLAIRVPVSIGSISDITFISQRPTSVKEINAILEDEASRKPYNEFIKVSHDDLVSTDIIKSPYASIIDTKMTKVVDGDLIKIMTWYDNEWGFSNQLIRQIIAL